MYARFMKVYGTTDEELNLFLTGRLAGLKRRAVSQQEKG